MRSGSPGGILPGNVFCCQGGGPGGQETDITVDGQFAASVLLDRPSDYGFEPVEVEKIDDGPNSDHENDDDQAGYEYFLFFQHASINLDFPELA